MTDSEELLSSDTPSKVSSGSTGQAPKTYKQELYSSSSPQRSHRSRRSSSDTSTRSESDSESNRSRTAELFLREGYPEGCRRRPHPAVSMDLKYLPMRVQKNLSYGMKFNCTMSTIRAYFLLFCLIDVGLHFGVYMQYLQHAKDFSLMDIIDCQMNCYDIHTSLIDLLLLSILRFFILLIIYGALRSNSRAGADFTTALTSLFVIVKPLYFQWEGECQTTWPVSMIGMSFVFGWLEAMLVDFRLISMEAMAHKYNEIRPDVVRKELPRVNVFRAFLPITGGLFRNMVIRSNSLTLVSTRPPYDRRCDTDFNLK